MVEIYHIIARTHLGAQDLYNGIPDLLNAEVVQVIHEEDSEDYKTTLVLRDTRGKVHRITIAQA